MNNCDFVIIYGRMHCASCGRVLSRAASPMQCPAKKAISMADEYPCIYRGQVIGSRPYKCGEGIQPLFECSEFESCTVTRYKQRQPEKDCIRCKKRQPPEY